MPASELFADVTGIAGGVGIVFVDVVAQVQDGIQIVAVGQASVRIEETSGEVRAAHHAKAQMSGLITGGGCPGAPGQRVASVGRKTVVVHRP